MPLIMERKNKVIGYVDSIGGNAEYGRLNDVSPTIRASRFESTNCIVVSEPVYRLQGNGIERSDTAGCCGKGWAEDTSYTLNTIDRHAVAYSQQAYDEYVEADKGSTLKARGGTYGGGSENIVVEPQYIVRRLCPVECARLQGFPDAWGHPDHKDDLTDEEYAFWLKVRNDWATINGKKVKEYKEYQMLKWYNCLHTDSAEYEMWGNGIALPNALYVMEGIAEVLRRRKNETD